MIAWIKNNASLIITILVIIAFIFYCYGCEPKARSLVDVGKLVNRQELQLELDQIISLAQLRMVDLDKQEQLRAVVLQNALILVEGQPLNPFGILSAIAAIYGITQGGSNITKVVKSKYTIAKVNNG